MSERPDPRTRPPDPAGTRPKVDPATLEPNHEQLALPPGHSSHESASVPPRTPSGQQSAEAGAPGAAVARPGVGRWPSSGAAGAGVAGTATGATAERGSAGESASAQGELAAPSGGSSRYSARFQFLFGALGALAVCVVALSVALVHRPAAAPGVAWASWAPSASGGDIAQQIAAHVGPEYRMPNGHQLVQVTGGPQAVGGQPVVLALRTSGANPTALPDNGVFYELCGEGPHCSIANGKASLERGLLVRREALELALYTFHYISGTSQVLVTFPPPPPSKSESSSHHAAEKGTFQFTTMTGSSSGQPPSRVLLFRPENVAEELAQPLKVTLQGVTPTVSDMNHSPGAPLVNRLTANLLFDSILIRQQQQSPVLLLESPSVGG